MVKRGIFNVDTLSPGIKKVLPAADAGVDLAFDAIRPIAETLMRTNAPWQDRTGNARNGLMSLHQKEPMVVHRLILYHSMPYGLWLEVRWSGRYAIIGPTLVEVSPQLATLVAAAVKRSIDLVG